jgi:tight adherence protein B
MPAVIALVVFIVVALAAFVAGSLIDQRSARARLIRDRLATAQKAPEREPSEELALVRDEQLSKIPAFDTLLRRSARVSAMQDALLQAGMKFRAGNFLLLCILSGVVAGLVTVLFTKNPAIGWAALVIGTFLPYSVVSYRRQKRFEKFEELFPEAIDTLARAVRAGHAFTTALEMISTEVAEPL